MDSQYIEAYLLYNEARITGGKMPVTPASFLSTVLRGKARTMHAKQYRRGLENTLRRRQRKGAVMAGKSARGKAAWIDAQMRLF